MASVTSPSKRQAAAKSRATAGPKAPVNLSSSTVMSETAVLLGHHTINISSESVIHPRAKLDSTYGRITIGRRCIVHERTLIGAPPFDGVKGDFGVVLEDYVAVEATAIIESGNTTVGEGCLLGVGVKIGRGAKLGRHCTLTAKTVLLPGEVVPDFTVVYSNGTRRTDRRAVTELKMKAQQRQIQVLKTLISSKPSKPTE